MSRRLAEGSAGSPCWLAPLHGIGHRGWRESIVALGGTGVCCAPFVRITDQRLPERWLSERVEAIPGSVSSVQLMGKDPAALARAAGILARAGAQIIDLNLGCPIRRVAAKGVGSALLESPALAQQIVARMRAALPNTTLSAKIRLGVSELEDTLSFAEQLAEAGIDCLVVHPRRRADQYDGEADWEVVARLVEKLTIPVIGNGDLWHASTALQRLASTGCRGVMFGRPALRNPWILSQTAALQRGVAAPEPDGEMLARHLESLAQIILRTSPTRSSRGARPDEATEGPEAEGSEATHAPLRAPGVLAASRSRTLAGHFKEYLRWILRAVEPGLLEPSELMALEDFPDLVNRAAHAMSRLAPEQLDLGLRPRFGSTPGGSLSGADPSL